MGKWTAVYLVLPLILMGCGGQGCEPIFVPVYDVMIYDSVSGELLCREQPGLSGEGNCKVEFDYSEDGEKSTISVALEGYSNHVEANVENETWRSGCFSNPSYTTEVSIYLDSNT